MAPRHPGLQFSREGLLFARRRRLGGERAFRGHGSVSLDIGLIVWRHLCGQRAFRGQRALGWQRPVALDLWLFLGWAGLLVGHFSSFIQEHLPTRRSGNQESSLAPFTRASLDEMLSA